MSGNEYPKIPKAKETLLGIQSKLVSQKSIPKSSAIKRERKPNPLHQMNHYPVAT